MEEIFEEFKPDVVVHTAASYKDPMIGPTASYKLRWRIKYNSTLKEI